ncbi:MAG: signal peptidase I [Pseudomonadota bacterium]
MDINFPLILVILVFASGLVALIDTLVTAKRRRPDEAEPVLVEYSKSFFPVLLIVLVFRSFLVEPFQIPSTSMVPTLKVGDFILVNKFTYGIRLPVIRTKVFDISNPKRGDVMVFFPPHQKRYFIKRVIGLPGDTVRYADNELYINGEKLAVNFIATDTSRLLDANDFCKRARQQYQLFEEVVDGKIHQMRRCSLPIAYPGDRSWVVPADSYFMIGDNRDNSSDSRDWGVVPADNIVGKAFAIWMHWESFSSFPGFSRVGGID